MQLIAAAGERADLVPLGLIAAGLVVAVLALLLLLPRPGGRRSAKNVATTRAAPGTPAGDAVTVARQLAAELDARADRLERLLGEAREAIARLESGAGVGAGGDFEGKPGAAPLSKSLDGLTTRIYELADGGRTPVEIAQATGQHTGQVELILALRR